jgi:signal transduction histidine kinase
VRNLPILRTSRLFVQLSAILVPSFLLASGVALAFLSSRDATVFEDALSTRLGGFSARTAAALERHAWAEEGERRWSAVLPRELLSNLLADPAILCARLESATAILAEVPTGLGCASVAHDGVFSVPLEEADGAPLTLAIGYSKAEVTEARRLRREFSLILLGGALLIALAASWFAFRVIVGRPLKTLLEELLIARREIERSGRAKTEFLAAISHDIRTPLNGVIALADELRRDLRDEEHRALVTVICDSGDMLLGLVNNFLDLSKIDSGRFELEDAPFRPSALMGQIEQLSSSRSGATRSASARSSTTWSATR